MALFHVSQSKIFPILTTFFWSGESIDGAFLGTGNHKKKTHSERYDKNKEKNVPKE